MSPDIKQFIRHQSDAGYFNGVVSGKWDIYSSDWASSPEPCVIIWIAASERLNSPEKFYFRFLIKNYPATAPDICIWDVEANEPLSAIRRPKGINNVQMLFRSDWNNGLHLYAPYEREGLRTHPDWLNKYLDMCWKVSDTIYKPLNDLWFNLNSNEYYGI